MRTMIQVQNNRKTIFGVGVAKGTLVILNSWFAQENIIEISIKISLISYQYSSIMCSISLCMSEMNI